VGKKADSLLIIIASLEKHPTTELLTEMESTTFEILKESAKISAIYCSYLFVLHFILAQISTVVFKKCTTKLTKKSEKLWHNKSVATIHAITMFYLAISYWTTVNPEMKISDHAGFHEKRCLDLMMGYLWYDSIYEVGFKAGSDCCAIDVTLILFPDIV
jgi:hypothetical protein